MNASKKIPYIRFTHFLEKIVKCYLYCPQAWEVKNTSRKCEKFLLQISSQKRRKMEFYFVKEVNNIAQSLLFLEI